MNERVVKQLVSLNRQFYSQFASPFSETRPSGQARLDRVCNQIGDAASVLDIGCGNGRLAERLEREKRRLRYVGVDASQELVAIARTRAEGFKNVAADFRVAELTEPGWEEGLGAPFEIGVALAVLHHIPSYDLRRDLVRRVNEILKPGALFIMTNWQFAQNERMRRKIVAWDTVGIQEGDLEEGDALLYWKHGGTGYRYCHLLTREEVQKLANESGFQVARQYYADATLNLYSLLKKEGESH